MKLANSSSEPAGAGHLPRFQRAAVHIRQLSILIAALGALALLLLAAAAGVRKLEYDALWQPLLLDNCAALLLLIAGLYAALQIARWRRDPSVAEPAAPLAADTGPRISSGWRLRIDRWLLTLRVTGLRLRRRSARVAQSVELCMGVAALLALLLVRRGWNWSLPGAALGQSGYVGAGVAFTAAFGLLVLDRYFSGRAAAEWPEASRLAYLVRAVILTLVIAGLALIFDSAARLWPARLAVIAGAVPAALALEMLIRAIFSAIGRAPAAAEPPYLADTFFSHLLTWPPRPFTAIHQELHDRFGIDLRQNWAFSFIRRTSLPVIATVAFVGWLLTGMHELPMASRGIYERFGKPVQVWEPGLHWGLPWPLGRALPVEYGVVHELSAPVADDAPSGPDSSTADDPAPPSANRLWDVSHDAENAQVISSEADSKQSFQVVNMDVRFVYRIGLTDAAVMAATYTCADVAALIRSTASRVMVHYFASRTLDGLLGEQRDVIARDIRRAVQGDLDRFGSGVELLAVLVESIHPPAGAAAAYHSVQAAQITAQAIVAQERGTAAATINDARQAATAATNAATAAARDNTVGADVTKLGFDAEQGSYREGGQAFLRERYFNQLAEGLAKGDLVIIDHRIGTAGAAPTIDLRTFSLGTSR